MEKFFFQQTFDELNDAIAYYEEQQSGLGLRLKEEVEQHIDWILDYSAVPRIRSGGYRRVNLNVFPILYRLHCP